MKNEKIKKEKSKFFNTVVSIAYKNHGIDNGGDSSFDVHTGISYADDLLSEFDKKYFSKKEKKK